MESKFTHFNLRIVEPAFESSLTDTILELERLRAPRRVRSRVHPAIFLQLKTIFHTLESLGSVRIEGNNTTLSDIVEKTIDGSIYNSQEEQIKEFMNNQEALNFIEEHIREGVFIDKKYISEFHKKIVRELDPTQEGDYRGGHYRTVEVEIKNSVHKPPLVVKVPEFMDELIEFINSQRDQKYKLLATAVAHHRFTWIHPFRNGNGRTVRLLTYAMLMSQGFAVDHILNPTAVFCNDRDVYYSSLAEADTGTDEGILKWCEYVLRNLLEEIKKIDKLLDYDYLIPNILIPALHHALERKNINQEEFQILKLAVEQGEIKAGDINTILKKEYHTQVSIFIRKLKKEGLLTEAPNKKRSYVISFTNNYLLRAVIEVLRNNNFINSLG
jgi:Fic family protein